MKKDVEGLNTKNCRGVKNSNLMLVAAVHKWRLNKISVAAGADIVIVFQVLVYSKPVSINHWVDFSLSRVQMSSKSITSLSFEPEIFESSNKANAYRYSVDLQAESCD